ncbi:acetylornithine deacetylase [Arthrobacter sp. SLBN-112]|uniref:acetylornithine deacetylase n=1 Tax=Arthrobacter sp. SLBN-112 TaxID=2768452 RepID=UPI00114E9ADA|nr:acetylornithine deacetylase [Arthrobacter sp. SLBN-112]TQJ38702.1 acetylornithine deacetylase [Arthrobacter sp. SLBN-112]
MTTLATASAEPTSSAPTAPTLDWVNKLVSFDTTSRNSNLPMIDAMAAALSAHGLAPVILPNPEGTKANLFATIPARDGSVTGGIMLAGHTDVVPVDGQDWASEPFSPEIRDGRLYGRGTTDMKAFSGAILGVLPEFLSRPLLEPLHLAWTYDEEVGCHGAVALVRELSARGILPRLCFVGEPTSMRAVSAHKSSQLYRVTASGRAAHSSMTPTGVNAIEYAARSIAFIRSLADEHRLSGPFDESFVVPYTTANVGVVSGGAAVNTVAEKCEFEFEFRTIPSDDPASVISRIEDHIALLRAEMQHENPAADICMTPLGAVPGLSPHGTGAALELAQALTGNDAEETVVYATEAGIFQRAGIDAVVCGPGSMDQGHTANEYIELTQIAACEEFLHNLAAHLSTTERNAQP